MIKPTLTYCCTLFIGISPHYKHKMETLQTKQLFTTIGSTTSKCESVENLIKRKSLIEVFKCLHKMGPSTFDKYFERRSHAIGTRGNDSLLTLQKVKTQSGRKTFQHQGALLFNKLPASIRNEQYSVTFKNAIKQLEL